MNIELSFHKNIIFAELSVHKKRTDSSLFDIKKGTDMTKKLSDFALNKENPFMAQTLVSIGNAIVSKPVKSSNTDQSAILKAVDTETGEILGNSVFMTQKVVDSDNFLKLMMSGFRAFYNLRPVSIRVLGYIFTLLKPNRDEFVFLFEECMQETGYGKTSVFKALAELCNAQIIARGVKEGIYYINPMVVFNGDRITFATTYINKNHPEMGVKKSTVKNAIKVLYDDDGKLISDKNSYQGE